MYFLFTGDTLGIPDTMMGLTFVAAGVSVPDALSSLAVAKEGELITFYEDSFFYFNESIASHSLHEIRQNLFFFYKILVKSRSPYGQNLKFIS